MHPILDCAYAQRKFCVPLFIEPGLRWTPHPHPHPRNIAPYSAYSESRLARSTSYATARRVNADASHGLSPRDPLSHRVFAGRDV